MNAGMVIGSLLAIAVIIVAIALIVRFFIKHKPSDYGEEESAEIDKRMGLAINELRLGEGRLSFWNNSMELIKRGSNYYILKEPYTSISSMRAMEGQLTFEANFGRKDRWRITHTIEISEAKLASLPDSPNELEYHLCLEILHKAVQGGFLTADETPAWYRQALICSRELQVRKDLEKMRADFNDAFEGRTVKKAEEFKTAYDLEAAWFKENFGISLTAFEILQPKAKG